jgi:peptidoglycan/xylan/chitin deacetylase (PgdA/CDA1 family)
MIRTMKNSVTLTVHTLSFFTLITLWVLTQSGCTAGTPALAMEAPGTRGIPTEPPIIEPVIPDAATILARPEVPILCYHQIRDWKPSDSKTARDYIVPVAVFQAQMKSLADSGYHAILPDELYNYLTAGKALPSKPVMITFDDTRMDQYTIALPALKKHGFKGAFFIMTVSLGRPGYMGREQVKQLSDEGHSIGSHTWDHRNVKKYTEADWPTQIIKPSKQLQVITGKPINYFAYPFGLWNKEAIAGLRKHGDFKGVFQLSARRDDKDPLYSIRRIIVTGEWSGATMQRCMRNSF